MTTQDPGRDRFAEAKAYGARRMRAEIASPDGKRLPADADLELALIADLLDQDTGGEALDVVRDSVDPAMFTNGVLGVFYLAICDIRDDHAANGQRERPIGRVELAAWLRGYRAEPGAPRSGIFLTDAEADLLGSVDTAMPLFERISDAKSRAVRVEARAERLRDLAKQRRLIERLWTTAAVGYSDDTKLFADALADMMAMIQESTAPKFAESEHISIPLQRVMLKYLRPTTKREPFATTGNPDLDAIMDLDEGDLLIIGARSGRGKSVLAADITRHTARKHGPVLVFTGEMNSDQMSLRKLCSEALVDSRNVKRNHLNVDESGKLERAFIDLKRLPIFYVDIAGIDIQKLLGIARREVKRIERLTGQRVRVIVVDYLQRVRAGRAAPVGANREQQIATVAFELKELAREIRGVVVSPSQLNADMDKRDDERPQVSDLRESKGIENEADHIILIHNPHYVERARKMIAGEPLAPEPCEITLGKQRNGAVGTAHAWFMAPFTTFKPMAPEEAEALQQAAREAAHARKARR